MENVKETTINLSKQGLKHIKTIWKNPDEVEILNLNDNELTNFENLEDLCNLQQLSASKNRIRRITNLPPFVNLCSLDLSNNSIVCIEGLKFLKSLRQLNLSGNYIKIIDHLHHNKELEYLDVSDNAIGHINDISYLLNLKELYLHKNHISSLRQCDKYLPHSLEVFTLSNNSITELSEISHLEKLNNLQNLSLKGNPCLETKNAKQGFNYRPYVKMWCLNITSVDDKPLNPLESLKAEWLYSQGRGRRFKPGDQESLISFLNTACPLTPQTQSAEEDKKLMLILSKAEQYKEQLRNQGDNHSRMVASYHDALNRHSARASPEVMSRSLDCAVLRTSASSLHKTQSGSSTERSGTPLQAASTLVPVPESLVSPDVCRPLHPLVPSGKRNSMSPLATPPTKIPVSPQSVPKMRLQQRSSPLSSPKTTPTKSAARKSRGNENRAPDENIEMSARKLQSIQLRASQKRHKQDRGHPPPINLSSRTSEKKAKVSTAIEADRTSDVWRAALCIQRRWRGYRARARDPVVTEACRTIQAARLQDYIMKVAEDMEATKTAVEGNRKLHVLQMKAIDAVWKKLDGSDVEGLVASCVTLSRQVEELRGLVQTMQENGRASPPVAPQMNPAVPTATQTDIIAVKTPQGDAVFPIPSNRPSRLNLEESKVVVSSDISTNQETKATSPEPVCWTPACQEGRDLQAEAQLQVQASVQEISTENPSSPTPSLD